MTSRGVVAGTCKNAYESSVSVKDAKFLEQLNQSVSAAQEGMHTKFVKLELAERGNRIIYCSCQCEFMIPFT